MPNISIWWSLCQWHRQVGELEAGILGNDHEPSTRMRQKDFRVFLSTVRLNNSNVCLLSPPFDVPGVWYHQMIHQSHFITLLLILSLLTHRLLHVLQRRADVSTKVQPNIWHTGRSSVSWPTFPHLYIMSSGQVDYFRWSFLIVKKSRS